MEIFGVSQSVDKFDISYISLFSHIPTRVVVSHDIRLDPSEHLVVWGEHIDPHRLLASLLEFLQFFGTNLIAIILEFR